jgi:hypothetical protein
MFVAYLKFMKRNYLFHLFSPVIICILLGNISVQAQNTPSTSGKKTRKERKADREARISEMIKLEEEGAVIYEKQNVFGFHLYSDGWGAMFEKGFQKTPYKTNLFSIELGERKHPKEVKLFDVSTGGGFIFGNPLIYGKENNFFHLKLGFGQGYLIGGKGNRNGVSVSAIYKGGLSLGGLKPYFVDIVDSLGQIIPVRWEGGDGEFDQNFLFAPLGGSGTFKGMGQMKLVPGVFGKGGLRFDYGRYNEVVSAIEVGFNIEYYTKEMPIMIGNEAKRFFTNVFVAIEFGRRK